MNVDFFLSEADYSSERIVNLNLNDPMNVESGAFVKTFLGDLNSC